MSTSWKKYGGTNKLDRMNNMNVNNLTTDTFSIQNPYQGDFDICGNLHAYNIFAGNLLAYNDLTVNGSLNITQLDVANLNVNTDSTINGNLTVVGRLTFDTSGMVVNCYFASIGDRLGLNTATPVATLDIHGNATSTLNVFSEQDYTRNIIAQNVRERGIAVETDSSSSAIVFYNDASMNPNTNAYSARIQYNKPGTLTIDVDETTNILSKVVVSNRTDISNILTSALTLYDVSSGIYQQNVYRNTSSNFGESITMVANDVSSVTMMHMITPNQKGLVVAAGAYPVDQERSMATLGWMDTTGTSNVSPAVIPAQMIVSGNNRSKYMSTIGINTYAPRTERYVLDINGPIHLANGQLRVAQNASFEIKQVNRSNAIRNKLIAVGTPSATSYPYVQNIYYSEDSGQSWNLVDVDPVNIDLSRNTDLVTAPNTFNGIYTYDNSFSVLAGLGGYMFYTVNNGKNWKQIAITANITFIALYIDVLYVVLISDATMYYFANPYSDISFSNPSTINISPADISAVSMTGFSTLSPAKCICGNGTFLFVAGTSYILKYNYPLSPLSVPLSSYSVFGKTYQSVHCNGTNVIAVGNTIISYSKDNGTTWANITPSANLKSVFILDDNRAVVAGDAGVVLYTVDGYVTWSPIPSDILRASGNAGILTDASNQFISIQLADMDTLVLSATRNTYNIPTSSTGNSYLYYCFLPSLFNANNNRVLDLCGNMLVSGKIEVEEGIFVNGNSRIATMNVKPYNVDISGNVSMDTLYVRGNAVMQYLAVGNIVVKSNATIDSNITINGNTTINNISRVLNTTEATDTNSGAFIIAGGVGIGANLFVGGNSRIATMNVKPYNVDISGNVSMDTLSVRGNAVMQYLTVGNIVVKSNATIDSNITINGNTTINNISRVLNTTEATDTVSGAFIIAGGVGIGANLFVGGNSRIATMNVKPYNVDISGNVSMDTLSVRGNAVMQYLTVGNIVVKSNATIDSNITINGNTTINNISRVLNTTEATNTASGAFIIAGGVGIGANLFVGGNISTNRDMQTTGNTRIINTTESQNKTTGAFVVSGGAGIGANLCVGGNLNVDASSKVFVYNTDYGNTYGQGALIVSGGASFGGNVNVSGNVNVAANIVVEGFVVFSGDTYIDKNSESVSTSTGSLVVLGGVGISANVFIGGNSTVYGNSRLNGNTLINNNTPALSDTTGALQVSGGAGISGNVYVGGFLVSANTTPSAGSTTGSLRVTGGAGISGNIYVGGLIVTENSAGSSSSTTGALRVTGGAGVSGNAYVGGLLVSANTSAATAAGTGALRLSGGGSIAGNLYVGHGQNSASVTTGTLVVNGGVGISANAYVGGALFATNTTASTSNTTGSLLVSGGVGVAGNLYVGHGQNSASVTTGTLVVNGGVGISANTYVGGNVVISASVGSQSSTTGALQVLNGVGIGGNTYVGGILVATNTAASTSNTTGSLLVSGGVGVAGNLYVGHGQNSASVTTGTLVVNGGVGINANAYVGGALVAVNTTASTSNTTGSLLVSGGVGVAGNLYLGHGQESVSTSSGTLVVNGGVGIRANTYVGGNVVISATVGSQSSTTGALQVLNGVGIGGNTYVGGLLVSANTSAATAAGTGALRLSGGGSIAGNLYAGHGQNSASVTTGTLVVNGGVGINANAYVGGALVAVNTTASTSTSTGSLLVSGGVGVAGNLYVGHGQESVSTSSGTLVVNGGVGIRANTYVGGNVVISSTVGSQSSTTGALQVLNGVGIGGNTYVGGILVATNTAASTSNTTGSLLISGGVGVAGNLYLGHGQNSASVTTGTLVVNGGVGINANAYVGGALFATNTTASTSNTTGSLLVSGGIGVAGNLYVGHGQNSASATTGTLVVNGGVGIRANTYVGGNVVISATVGSQSSTTGALQVLNGVGIGGNTYVGGILVATNTAASTTNTTGSLLVSGGVGIAGNLYAGHGQNSASVTTGTLVVNGGVGINANAYVGGALFATNTTASTSNTTGSLLVSGGIGVAGNLYLGHGQNSASATTGTLVVNGGVGISANTYVGGNVVISATVGSQSSTTGALQVLNGVGIGGNTYVGGLLVSANTAASTSNTTGSLLVSGGVGIAGNLYLGHGQNSASVTTGTLVVNGGVGISANTYVGGVLFAVNTTASTSTSTGSLLVSGGVGIIGNTYVGGQAVIRNSSASLGSSTTGALLVDGGVGIGGNLFVDNMIRTRNNIHNKQIVLYDNSVNEPPSTATNFFGFGVNNNILRYQANTVAGIHSFYSGSNDGTMVGGNLLLNNNNGATTTESGTLRVVGGAGIGGNVYVGGTIVIANTAASLDSATTGGLQTIGGAGIGGNLYVYDQLRMRTNNNINKKIVLHDGNFNENIVNGNTFYGFGVQPTTNELKYHTFAGATHKFYGGSADGNLNAGILTLTSTTDSISDTNSGGLRVVGGAAIAGNVFAGSLVRSANNNNNKKFVLWDSSLNEPVLNATNFFGFGVNGSNTLRYQTDSGTASHRFYSGTADGNLIAGGLNLLNTTSTILSTGTGALIVSGGAAINGNIFANSMIRTHNSFHNKKIVVLDNSANEPPATATRFYGFGVSGDTLRYQTDTSGVHRFFTGTANGNVIAGQLQLTANIVSDSTNVGTLRVTGGIGVGGQVTADSLVGRVDVNNDASFTDIDRYLVYGDSYGIPFRLYSGYFEATNLTPLSIRGQFGGNSQDFTNLSTSTNYLVLVDSGINNISIEWYGYMYISPDLFIDIGGGFAQVTFQMGSDDGSRLWFEAFADSGYNDANAIINRPGGSSYSKTESPSQYPQIGTYQPIRFLYGNSTGNMNFSLEFKNGSDPYRSFYPGIFFPRSGNPKFTPFSSNQLLYNTGRQRLTVGNVVINSNTDSTTTSTGALTVTGGVGIAGQLRVGTGIDISGSTSIRRNVIFYDTASPFTNTTELYKSANNFVLEGKNTSSELSVINKNSSGISYTNASFTSATTNINTDELIVRPSTGLSTDTAFRMTYLSGVCYLQTGYTGNSTFAPIRFTNPGDTTAALGIDANKRVVIGTNTSTTDALLTVASTGNVSVLSTADSVSSSTTGAITVAGGIGIGGNLYVQNMIRMSHTTAVNKKLVLFDNGVTDLSSTATNFYGFGVNASTLRYQAPTGATHRFYTSTSDGSILAGNLQLTSTNGSTTTSTGALIVTGGVGIGGNIYVGGVLNGTTGVFNSGLGVSNSSILQVNGSARSTRFYAQLNDNDYNPAVDANDSAIIVGSSASDGSVLYLGTWANAASGIRITNATVIMSSTSGNPVTMNNGLTVTGTVTATAFNATSDYRIKSNIVPLEITDYSIDKLKPVYYYNTISQKNDIGFLAHEVQSEYPFLVSGEKDGEANQTLNYTGLIGVLVKEVQELKKTNAALAESNTALKNEMRELKEFVMRKLNGVATE